MVTDGNAHEALPDGTKLHIYEFCETQYIAADW